jgi:hypothetical protein
MQNDNTRGSLGSKFEGFGAAPSDGLWGSIADSLDGKKKRRIAIWWWLGAAAVTLAGVGVFMASTMNDDFSADSALSNQTNDNNIIHVDPINVNGANDTIDYSDEWGAEPTNDQDNILTNTGDNSNWNQPEHETHENLEANNDRQLNTHEVDKTAPIDGTNKLDQKVVNQLNDVDVANQTNVPNSDHPEQPNMDDQDAVTQNLNTDTNPEIWESAEKLLQLPLREINYNYSEFALDPITAQKPPSRKWEMGISINSWSSLKGISKQQSVYEDADPTLVENDFLESINSGYDVSVQRPIGLKFHVGYQLTRRLRLVSGLSTEYTSYRYKSLSEFSGGQTVTGVSTTTVGVIPAKLTSIGIPLGITFDFLKRKRLQMGTGLSVLNEFPFLETYRPDYDANYVGPESNVRNFINGYSFGLNFNLNASVYLTDKMRIQANPGLRWYGSQKSSTSLSLQKRDFWLGGSVSMIWDLGR